MLIKDLCLKKDNKEKDEETVDENASGGSTGAGSIASTPQPVNKKVLSRNGVYGSKKKKQTPVGGSFFA